MTDPSRALLPPAGAGFSLAPRLVGVLLSCLLLAACATARPAGVSPAGGFCAVARPILVSPADTEETLRQILMHNEKIRRLCPGGSKNGGRG